MAGECKERSVLCWDYNQGMAISAALGTSDNCTQKSIIKEKQTCVYRIIESATAESILHFYTTLKYSLAYYIELSALATSALV